MLENNCVRVFFLIKLQAWSPATLFKKTPVDIGKFLRTDFFKNNSGGCFWVWLTLKDNATASFGSSVFTVNFEHISLFLLSFSIHFHFKQVNAGCVQNMYVSCRLKNQILATTKTRKGVTLNEVKHQNNAEVVLMFCCASLNFYLASISFATLSMYFVHWFNFANVKTIVLAFIRNSTE